MDNNYVTWVDLSLRSGPTRSQPDKGLDARRIGMRLVVKAAPQVEEYMSQLSRNRKVPVDSVSDIWHNVGSSDPLEFYQLDEKIQTPVYTLNSTGQPLIITARQDDGLNRALRTLTATPTEPEGKINLSFLTLVGISKDDGVTIGFGGVYSGHYIKGLQRSLMQATEQFLRDYLVPVTVNMQIVSRPF